VFYRRKLDSIFDFLFKYRDFGPFALKSFFQKPSRYGFFHCIISEVDIPQRGMFVIESSSSTQVVDGISGNRSRVDRKPEVHAKPVKGTGSTRLKTDKSPLPLK
jgi:hypothetical protein